MDENFRFLQARIRDPVFQGSPEKITKSVVNLFFPKYAEEFCKLFDHATLINPRYIRTYCQYIHYFIQIKQNDVDKAISNYIQSGIILRYLFSYGNISKEFVKSRCDKDFRLYAFFLDIFELPQNIPKISTILKNFISKIDELKQNDWKTYKEKLENGYELNSVQHIIKNDFLDSFIKLEHENKVDLKANYEISPLELFNIPTKHRDKEKKTISLAAHYGALNIFRHLSENPEAGQPEIRDLIASRNSFILSIAYEKWPLMFAKDNLENIIKLAVKYDCVEILTNVMTTIDNNLISPYKCVKKSNYIMFKKIIDNVHQHDEKKEFLLHLAAERKMLSIVELLINVKHFDVNQKDSKSFTALHKACKSNATNIVTFLVDNKADIEAKGKSGITPLMTALESGNRETVIYLLTLNANYKAKDDDMENAWHFVAKSGNCSIIDLLDGYQEYDEPDKNGLTPIMNAVLNGNVEFTEQLMNRKVNITRKTADGKTLLHLAVKSGNLDIIKIFAQKIDINAQDNNGRTPLFDAIPLDDTKIMEFLVQSGTDVNIRDSKGRTAAFELKKSNANAMKFLISHGLIINNEDNDKHSILCYLVKNKLHRSLRVLLKEKPNMLHINEEGITDQAYMKKYFNDSDFKKYYSIYENAVKDSGESPKQFAIRTPINRVDGQNMPKSRISRQASHDIKLEKVNFDHTDIPPRAKPRVWASKSVVFEQPVNEKQLKIQEVDATDIKPACKVEPLPSNNRTSIDAQNNKGMTLLHIAARDAHFLGVQSLLDHGADPNITDNDGKAPLHYAVLSSSFEIANLLIQRGAKKNIADCDGHTPYDLQLARINIDLVNILK